MTAKLICYVLIRDRAAGRVLLVEYQPDLSPNPKRTGLWIPAPELADGQHPEDAARAVLASLGVPAGAFALTLAGIDSFVTRDWHVMFNYVADLPPGAAVTPDARYAAAAWYEAAALPEAKTFAHGGWERELALKMSGAVS